MIRPGVRMYQLALIDGILTTQFPTDYENFNKTQIRDMYNWVRCNEDFKKMREENSEYQNGSNK